MSDQTEYEGEESSTASSAENWRKKVQAERDEAKAEAENLKAQIAEFERQKAFSEAGINLESPKFKYFAKGYEGEINAEAIKAAAIEAELIPSVDPAIAAQASQHAALDAGVVGAAAVPPSGSFEEAARELQSIDDPDALWAEAVRRGVFKTSN